MNMISSAYGRRSGASRLNGRCAAIRMVCTLALFAAVAAHADETISASVTLVADRVVSGVLNVESGVVVDLAGYRLTASGLAGDGEITDSSSSATPGELWLDVSGTTANSTVAISGNLKFVLDGGGKFTASKTGQTYTGGTVVTNGTLVCASASANTPFGANNTDVTVYDGGAFDCAGYDNTKYVFVLVGGSLKSSSQIKGSGNMNSYTYSTRYSQLSKVRLEKDSSFSFSYSYGFVGANAELDLGGCTLTVSIGDRQYFQLRDLTIRNGNLVIATHSRGYGVLCWNGSASSEFALDATDAHVKLNGELVTYKPNASYNPIVKLGDFEDVSTYYGTRQISGIRNNIKIYGTYKPTSANSLGCVMQDGSTLDLSGKSGTWSTTSAASADNTVVFADNATIAVKIGSRHVSSQTPIITWTTAPANLATLKFVCGDADRNYSLEVKEDGVYVKQGLFIYMR